MGNTEEKIVEERCQDRQDAIGGCNLFYEFVSELGKSAKMEEITDLILSKDFDINSVVNFIPDQQNTTRKAIKMKGDVMATSCNPIASTSELRNDREEDEMRPSRKYCSVFWNQVLSFYQKMRVTKVAKEWLDESARHEKGTAVRSVNLSVCCFSAGDILDVRYKHYAQTENFICNGSTHHHHRSKLETEMPFNSIYQHKVEASEDYPVESFCCEYKVNDSNAFNKGVWKTAWEKCLVCQQADEESRQRDIECSI